MMVVYLLVGAGMYPWSLTGSETDSKNVLARVYAQIIDSTLGREASGIPYFRTSNRAASAFSRAVAGMGLWVSFLGVFDFLAGVFLVGVFDFTVLFFGLLGEFV